MAGISKFQGKGGELSATWVCSTHVALNSPVPFLAWRLLAVFILVLAVNKPQYYGEYCLCRRLCMEK
jgi:hypothetical protein